MVKLNHDVFTHWPGLAWSSYQTLAAVVNDAILSFLKP